MEGLEGRMEGLGHRETRLWQRSHKSLSQQTVGKQGCVLGLSLGE